MRVIFGIGNPGIRYEHTRHNAGFLLLDHFAEKRLVTFKESKCEFLQGDGLIQNVEFKLVKPVTYVNSSGIAAKQVCDMHNISPGDFLVLCDDINLPNFTFRVRLSGGDGGHNGLSSIINHLVSDQFPRIRIGIGSNASDRILSDYVLSKFSDGELEQLNNTFSTISKLIEEFIIGGNKKMLEANSLLLKSDNQNNSNQNT